MATVDRTHGRLSELSWDSARHGLLVALFALYPFHLVADVGIAANFSLGDPILGLAIALWALGLLGPRDLPRYSGLVAAFALLGLGSLALASVDPPAYVTVHTGLVEYVKLLGAIAWFVGVFVLVAKRPSRFVPTAAAVSVLLAALFAAVSVYDAIFFDAARKTGPFENPNIYGNYLVFNACLGLYVRETWIADRWPGTRWLALAAVGLTASAVLVTGSRGTLIGAGLAAAFIVAGSVTLSRRQSVVAVSSAALASLATVLLVQWRAPFLTSRFLSAKNLQGRIELWTTAIEAFRTSPILGIGYGQYQHYLASQGGGQIGAHSTYLLVAAEMGLVGLVAFCLLLAVVLLDGYDVSERRPAVLYLVAFAVAAAGQALVTDVDNFRAVWIAIGFLSAYSYASADSGVDLGAVRGRLSAALSRG